MPVYALLSLPVAALASGATARVRPGPARPGTAVALVGLLALHLSGQYMVLRHDADAARAVAGYYRAAADGLRHLGLRPPCLVAGSHALPVGYYAGCASAETSGNNRSTTTPALLRRAATEPTAVLTGRSRNPPRYARAWHPHRLTGTGWTAYVR